MRLGDFRSGHFESAASRPSARFKDGSLLKKLNASGMKSHVFMDDYVEDKEDKDEDEVAVNADIATTKGLKVEEKVVEEKEEVKEDE